MKWITVKYLQNEFGLSWMQAETLIRDHTRPLYMRHWLPVLCSMSGLLLPSLLIAIIHPLHLWMAQLVRLSGLLLLIAGMLATRVLARDAIVEAAKNCTSQREVS